ncbi:MAG: peptidoglycan editing factor PgeF [Clostridia bacterium]|nr:peptidoglycan editing factor PgeF [Clostridia bacterium]
MDLSNENVIHVKKDGIEYLQFRKLLEYGDLINHAYSLGIDRNYRTAKANKEKLDAKTYERAIKDYKELCNSIGSNLEHLVKPNQNHTKEVKIVEKKININEPDFNVEQYDNTDGLITNKKNLLIGTTNADCILLLFFDPVKNVIANVHSGWKGTVQRISIETVKKMKTEYGCAPNDIICCICPSIRKCHFEVDKEVKEIFEQEFQDIDDIQSIIQETKNGEKWKIDTVKINQILLQKEGLKLENIIDSKICNVCNSNLMHSYRVEKQGYGLNVALIEMRQ